MHSGRKKSSSQLQESILVTDSRFPFFKQKDEEWREVSRQIVDEETIVCEGWSVRRRRSPEDNWFASCQNTYWQNALIYHIRNVYRINILKKVLSEYVFTSYLHFKKLLINYLYITTFINKTINAKLRIQNNTMFCYKNAFAVSQQKGIPIIAIDVLSKYGYFWPLP